MYQWLTQQNRISTLEAQKGLEKSEKNELKFEIESVRKTLKAAEDKFAKENVKNQILIQKQSDDLQLLDSIKVALEKQLESKKAFEENEKHLKEQIAVLSRQSSSSNVTESQNSNLLQRIQILETNIHTNEAEIQSLRKQLLLITANRDEMADELVKMSNETESMYF